MKHVRKLLILLLIGFSAMELSAQVQGECKDIYDRGLREMANKDYSTAIVSFNSAKVCEEGKSISNINASFVRDCNKKIEECRRQVKKSEGRTNTNTNTNDNTNKKVLTVSSPSVNFDANGGSQEIAITGTNNWSVSSIVSDWCNIEKKASSVVIIAKPNKVISARSVTFLVLDGTANKQITVTQGKADEYLRPLAGDLSFSPKGNEESITIQSNTEWDFSGAPNWCTVKREGDKLIIIALPNNTTKERSGSITINSNSLEKEILLSQIVGNETLSASKNSLSFSNLGAKETVNIYTDSENWVILDFPKWCSVTKVNEYAILVECLENNTTKPRSETIQIRTNKQTLGLKVSQERGYEATIIRPTQAYSSKELGGRDVSFGITAGLILPSISASSSSDFLGSVVNYGYGTEVENASYKAEAGFTVGALLDFRLYKNLYLQVGLNYTNVKYKNSFSGSYYETIEYDNGRTLEGSGYDDHKEDYTMNFLDMPILFSYRFKLSHKTNLQLNAGPYVSYGLSGKMKLSGTTNFPSLDEYYYSKPSGENYYINSDITGEMNLFGKDGFVNTQYTTGDASLNEKEYEFSESPFTAFNYGLSLGAGIELSGFNIGLSYDIGLNNMANEDYWTSKRLQISDYSMVMEDYNLKLSRFSVKIAYIFRW